MTNLLPYFAGFVSVLFILGFLFAIGEKIGNNISKEQKEKIKQND